MIDRRAFLTSLMALLTAPFSVEAQQPGRVARIGSLSMAQGPNPAPHLRAAFLEGLRDHGWIEGQNIVIERRYAAGDARRLNDLAMELVRLRVELITVVANDEAMAVRRASASIPIVIVNALDPVGLGLVASLARPGGSITGLTWDAAPTIHGKNLDLLAQVLPLGSRIAAMANYAHPINPPLLKAVDETARRLGIGLVAVDVREPGDIEPGFALMRRERVAGFTVLADTLHYVRRAEINQLALRERLASMWAFREGADSGGLMGYGPNVPDMFRRWASYVDRILRGAKPGDLPMEQPTKFELIINLKTAKALALTIPPAVLARADQIIQ